MNEKTSGGPAFPTAADNGHLTNQDGMTLRDYFAAKAMQSLIATDNYGSAARVCAKDAYEFADAMLDARQST